MLQFRRSGSGSCMWRKPINHSCSPTGAVQHTDTHVCMQTCMSTHTPVAPPPMAQTQRDPPQFPQNMPDNQSNTHTPIPSNHPSFTSAYVSIHVRSAFSPPPLSSLKILQMTPQNTKTEGGNTQKHERKTVNQSQKTHSKKKTE